ncbi:aromatic ring-hydroxylating oxygenase subunit alpha, partial [Burkholderia orbicola]|uniref:aromatic ring-hydroxylating oxygenase subunit alpha n=1 Tax=Burkholderia orbicola TaxID=2978683 RepID=UPI0039A6EBBF
MSTRRKIDRNAEVWDGISRHKLSPLLYWEPELYKDEMDLIFQTTWVYVGHESEIGEPKTYVRKKVAGQELVLTRSSDGEIHVLFNRCTHRGSLVCNADKGQASLLRCMYHGWMFELDGALRGAPRSDAYTDFSQRRAELGLAKPVATEIYGGFIFCRLKEDDTAPSFEHFIAPVRPAIDRLLKLSPNG